MINNHGSYVAKLGLELVIPGSAVRTQGYKTFFMLNSAEDEICPANKSQITNNCKNFLA